MTLVTLQGWPKRYVWSSRTWLTDAAAHAAVDKAESELEFAELLNATSVAAIAKERKYWAPWRSCITPTDYVFDGSGERPWVETDATAPLASIAKQAGR